MKHKGKDEAPGRSDKGDPDRKEPGSGKPSKKPEPPPRDTHEWPSENPPAGQGSAKRDRSAGHD